MPKRHEFQTGECRLGPAVQLPPGTLEPDDDGAIAVALAVDYPHAIVRVMFGAPIAWFGLGADEARHLAQTLVELAEQLERRRP